MSGDCSNRDERLVSLLYEDGDPAELAEIRAHLDTCERCREVFAELGSTRELLGAWSEVDDTSGIPAGASAGAGNRRWGRIKSFLPSLLPSLAAAATVVLLFGLSATFVRFEVGSDGRLRAGFGWPATSATEGDTFVRRGDLDQGLARTAGYLEALMRTAREEDRRVLLGAVDQALQDEHSAMGGQVTRAIDSAFEEMDRRRRADLGVVLSAMNDLQAITTTELQRINAILASLAPPSDADRE